MSDKVTLVVGASSNEMRYSNMAIKLLTDNGHEIYAYAKRKDTIGEININTDWPKKGSIDTITMYVGVSKQPELYDKIMDLNPRRIIFNPGTENHEFANKLKEQGIETVMNCSLVMLRGGFY